jgi:hypothetical protein
VNISAHISKSSLLVSMMFMISCSGMLDAGGAGPRGAGPRGGNQGDPGACAPGTNSETDRVRLGLAPTCDGCHLDGNTGYFASLNAFETLLVANDRLVKPGNPDESELVMLLEGRRTGNSMTQMPLSGDPFSIRATRGETGISLEEVREWISALEVPAISTRPNPTVATVQRIGAGHLEFGLLKILGLSQDDFFRSGLVEGVIPFIDPMNVDLYGIHDPDRVPIQFYPSNNARFMALGGRTTLYQQSEDRTLSLTFMQTFVPLSQAWCGLAVNKPGNTTLFTVATPTTGTSEISLLREQIRDWYLMFLAKDAGDSEIDFVVDRVFARHEAASNTNNAWVGTCSYFVRHPLFVYY